VKFSVPTTTATSKDERRHCFVVTYRLPGVGLVIGYGGAARSLLASGDGEIDGRVQQEQLYELDSTRVLG
jgi:restriction endonuclease Mrr